MPSEFLRRFGEEAALLPVEMSILRVADVRSYADVDSVLRGFPSISEDGVRIPYLSNLVSRQTTAAYSTVVAQMPTLILAMGNGAEPPPGAPWPVGTPVPPSAPPAGAPPTGGLPRLVSSRIDLRRPQWVIRDQGRRGTCVAFGTTACFEFPRSGNPAPPDFSEQFLYWAIKTGTADPRQNQDGTSLFFAREALAQIGICDEQLWPYNGLGGSSITQATASDPSVAARTQAAQNRTTATNYQQAPGVGAAAVLAGLQQGRPVALSLPVFRDAAFPTLPTNWLFGAGLAYGRVLNPVQRSVVVGGHAVCAVGFEPDPEEPMGGYFIVRNSWGSTWASQAPSPGNSHAPEVGYGDISATYVDTYLWELLQL